MNVMLTHMMLAHMLANISIHENLPGQDETCCLLHMLGQVIASLQMMGQIFHHPICRIVVSRNTLITTRQTLAVTSLHTPS